MSLGGEGGAGVQRTRQARRLNQPVGPVRGRRHRAVGGMRRVNSAGEKLRPQLAGACVERGCFLQQGEGAVRTPWLIGQSS